MCHVYLHVCLCVMCAGMCACDARAKTITVWLMEQTEGRLCVMYACISKCDAQARAIAVWLMEQTEGHLCVMCACMCACVLCGLACMLVMHRQGL